MLVREPRRYCSMLGSQVRRRKVEVRARCTDTMIRIIEKRGYAWAEREEKKRFPRLGPLASSGSYHCRKGIQGKEDTHNSVQHVSSSQHIAPSHTGPLSSPLHHDHKYHNDSSSRSSNSGSRTRPRTIIRPEHFIHIQLQQPAFLDNKSQQSLGGPLLLLIQDIRLQLGDPAVLTRRRAPCGWESAMAIARLPAHGAGIRTPGLDPEAVYIW